MRLRRLAAIAVVALSFGAAGASGSHATAVPLCKSGYYRNVSGTCVHRPDGNSKNATARCRDGTYSHSKHASGTCSGHGGVARWIHHP